MSQSERPAFTVAELAVRQGCQVIGDPHITVDHVATLSDAGVGAISFLSNPKYRQYLSDSKASAVIVDAAHADSVTGTALVADDPYVTYARVAAMLYPPPVINPGIHASAVVDPTAQVSPEAEIAANAVIGAGSVVGGASMVGAGSVIGADCRIGEATRLAPNVTLMDNVSLGDRCVVHAGAVIGSDGFGIARGPQGWERVPQVGGVIIGDDVDIGACTSIDRGAIEPTRIANGVKLDNQIQIGHNCVIGEHTVMAGMVGIAGSTVIGANCAFGGNSGTTGHITIADGVVITARTTVTNDIDSSGTFGGVFPHDDIRQHQRNVARYRNLDKLARKVRELEKAVRRGETE
ncbi:MAG: UDP-3-O-(3-hydroxymyristoyl)glucosamine N-acyltransferase [Pseudomonadota bacterium]